MISRFFKRIWTRLLELIRFLNLVRISFASQLKLGGIIAFSTLGAASILLIMFYINAYKQTRFVNQSNETMYRLESLSNLSRETESAVRGYVVTGYKDFIKDLDNKIANCYSILDELQKNASSDIERQKLEELEPIMTNRFIILKRGITNYEGNKNDALATSDFMRGKVLMDRLIGIISWLEKHERAKRSERLADYNRSSSTALIIIIVIIVASGGTLALVFLLLKNEFRVRKEHESRLYDQQIELEEKILLLNSSNEALEQFAYVASHDLQEPLRKIMTFSDRLISKKDDLDEDTKQYLERIVNAAGRMRILIHDLLSFSRVSRDKTTFNSIDLNEIISTVLDDMELLITEKQAVINTVPLPRISGEPVQMAQLFQNLISNAIKFSRPGIRPEVTISCREVSPQELFKNFGEHSQTRHYCITVKDNGIGFDQKYADRIFVIFQRLHSRSQYEGTGIGLAVCKRIVENHGGFITVNSSPGEGAAFSIYLPAKNRTQTVINTAAKTIYPA